MEEKTKLGWLYFLLFLALIIRGTVVFYQADSFSTDPDDYRRLAHNIADHGVFGTGDIPTAYRPPCYPLLLRGMLYLTVEEHRGISETSSVKELLLTENAAIALLHWGLGLLTVLLTWCLARQLYLSERGAFLAGFLVAIDPILLQQSRLVMTETLAVFFSVLILWLLVLYAKDSPLGELLILVIGISLGLATLCRPAFLIFAILVFIGIIFVRIGPDFVPTHLPIFLIGLALPLVPWSMRNLKEFDSPFITTTHGGYTLLLANNDSIYDYYEQNKPWEKVWDAQSFHSWYREQLEESKAEYKSETGQESPVPQKLELYQDKRAQRKAMTVIQNRPDIFVKSIFIRIGNLWQFLPYKTDAITDKANLARYGVGAFYFVEFLLMLIGIFFVFREGREARIVGFPCWGLWCWVFLLIFSVQIPHLFYWTNMRMRAPLIVAIAVLVGLVFSVSSTTNAYEDQ